MIDEAAATKVCHDSLATSSSNNELSAIYQNSTMYVIERILGQASVGSRYRKSYLGTLQTG